MGGNRDRSEGVRLRKPVPTIETLLSAGASSQSAALTLAVGAAGTAGQIPLPYRPILNSDGNAVGKFGDSSLSFSGTALTTEVPFEVVANRYALATKDSPDINNFENKVNYSAYLEDGEYYVIYETGDVFYKKDDNSTAVTATFKIASPTGAAPGSVGAPTVSPVSIVKVVAAAATAEPLTAAATPVVKAEVQADFANTGSIYVGDSSVDSTDVELIPGSSITLESVDLNEIYIDADVNGEGVRILYYT